MAKINHVRRKNDIWTVLITVDDPDCKWNINPKSTFRKIIKANNPNAAVRNAASYCNRQMQHFPGTFFTYSTKEVEPYFYPIRMETTPEDSTGVRKIKI